MKAVLALGTAVLAVACSSSATSMHVHHAPPSPPAALVRACGEMVVWMNLSDPTQQTIYASKAALDSRGTKLSSDFIRLVNDSAPKSPAMAKVAIDAHRVFADCAGYGVRGPWLGVLYPPGPSIG